MKAILKPVLLPVFALLLAAAPLSRVQAQQSEFKPAVVISVASVDEILSDASYLAELGGVREQATMMKGMVGLMTAGVDPKRPAGAYLTFSDDQQPVGVVFIPVTDLKGLLKIHEGSIGEAEDAGDGLLRIDGPGGGPLYLKETGGWAFASKEKNLLVSTPADPTKLLAGLDKEYTVAARVMVRNIPAAMRQMAIAQLQQGVEAQLKEAAEKDDDNRELMEIAARNNLESIKSLVEDSDVIELGWAVDSAAKSTYLDFSMTALPGTKLARQMENVKAAKSNYAGFLMPEAAASLLLVSEVAPEQIEQWTAFLDAMDKRAAEAIDNDSDLKTDEERTAAKEILQSLIGIARKSAESGQIDAAGSLLLEKSGAVVFAMGGRLADSAKLDEVLRKAAKLAEKEDDFPGIKFDADKQGDVTFHTMSVPLKDADDKVAKALGDKLDVAIGVGKDAFYLAMGKDPVMTLKKGIEQSAAAAGSEQPPMQFNIAVAPIVEFVAAMSDDDPIAGILAAKVVAIRGNDRVTIVSMPIKNGARSRIQVDEGVLKLLGEVGTTFGMGAGGPGGPVPGAF